MVLRKTLKPARPGLLVRDPVTKRALPPEGAQVTFSSYWVRRLDEGDVLEVATNLIPDSESTATQKGEE
jgi:hypothetical protein